MSTRNWIAALGVGLVTTALVYAEPVVSQAQVDALVRKLGSASFMVREQARKDLETLGPAALEPLRRQQLKNDAETNHRVAELIRSFEEQALTKQILAPKVVELSIKDHTVQQALAELALRSGYPVQFLGDATPFANKKITLAGKMTFWEAFDRICDEANLMDRASPQAGPIVVVPRDGKKAAVSYTGAVKTELRIHRDASAKELVVQLIISSEPRLLNGTLMGRTLLDRAMDQRGKALQTAGETPQADAKTAEDRLRVAQLQVMAQKGLINPYDADPYSGLSRHSTVIRVKDDQAAKQLIELAGRSTMQVDVQNETLARIDKVLDAAGKSVDGANGGSMKVFAAKKLPSGEIEVQVSLANLTPNPFGGNVIINGNGRILIRGGGKARFNNGNFPLAGNMTDLPDLLDAKGQKFRVSHVSSDSVQIVNGSAARAATVVYHPNAGQADAAELVLFGTRTRTISVPFRFENVPLP